VSPDPSPEEIASLTEPSVNISILDDLVSSWGLSRTDFSEVAISSFEDGSVLPAAQRTALQDNCGAQHQFWREFKKLLVNRRTATLSYLDSIGFFNSKSIGLVDLGWVGSISRNLEAVHDKKSNGFVTTFFLATSPDNYETLGLVNQKHFFFPAASLDGSRNPLLFQELWDCAPALEVLMGRDDLFSTSHYILENDAVLKVDHIKDVMNKKNIWIQQNFLDVCRLLLKNYLLHKREFYLKDSLLHDLSRLKFFQFFFTPHKKDVQVFLGSTLDPQAGAPNLPLVVKLGLREVVGMFSYLGVPSLGLWIRGTLSLSGLPRPLMHIVVRLRLLRIRLPGILR
jgi:hypothetical protein